jgi:hypothetical protein
VRSRSGEKQCGGGREPGAPQAFEQRLNRPCAANQGASKGSRVPRQRLKGGMNLYAPNLGSRLVSCTTTLILRRHPGGVNRKVYAAIRVHGTMQQ